MEMETTSSGLLRSRSGSSAAVSEATGAVAGVSLAAVPASECPCAPLLLLAAGASGPSSGSSLSTVCLRLQTGHSKTALGTCVHQSTMQSAWNSCPHCNLRHPSFSSMFRRQTTHWLPSRECDTGNCSSMDALPIVLAGGIAASPVPLGRPLRLSSCLCLRCHR